MQDNCFPSFFAAAQQSQRNAANRRLISIEAKTQAEEMEGRWLRRRKTVVQFVWSYQRPQTQFSPDVMKEPMLVLAPLNCL